MREYNKNIRGKLFIYFKDRLSSKKSTNGWVRSKCYYCGGVQTMGINLQSFRVHCFKCGETSTPLKLLMEIESFKTYQEAYKFISIQQEYEAYEDSGREKIEITPVNLPESFQLLSLGNSMVAKAARHYMKKRGYKIDELSINGVGYCSEGEYGGYIVFPYYRKGKLVYFQGRLFMGAGTKMKNPLEAQFGVGKTQIIYNEDALYIYRKVYILESITNSLTLGSNASALSGKKASNWQMSKIISSPCEKAIIILDPDAYDEALDLALQLVHYKKTKVVKLPDGVDVNDYGRNKTLRIVRNTEYKKYMDLYREKLNINGQTSFTPHQRVGPRGSATRGY